MEPFEIPSHKSELDVHRDLSKSDILSYLQEAKASYKNGTGYILEECKAYFSAIFHSDILPIDIIHAIYTELHRGIRRLNEDLGPILSNWSDEDVDDSLRQQYLNIIKIHFYCYTQIIFIFESKEEEKQMKSLQLKRPRKKADSDSGYYLDKKQIIVHLNTLIHHNIKCFWSPPIVEGSFINLISEVCYRFLQNPSIKGEKAVLTEIWSFLGTLVKDHNHGNSFVIRIVDLIKLHEHLVQCLPEGFKFLVENYNCKGMLHNLIQEVTEWQTNEKYQDAQGARFCSQLLVEMAILMPNWMLPEVMYLTRYLCYESHTLRNCVLSVITEVISHVLTKHNLTDEEKEFRDEFIAILKEHIGDSSPLVRSKVFQHWSRLQKENSIPLKNQNEILEMAIEHLRDKGSLVRKSAANLVTLFLSHNSYSYDLKLSERKESLQKIEEEVKKMEEENERYYKECGAEMESKWASIKDDVQKFVEEEYQEESESQDIPQDVNDVSDIIKMYLESKDYKSAVKLCRTAEKVLPTWKDIIQELDSVGKVALTMELLKSTFVKPALAEEMYKKMTDLNAKAEFLRETVTFLTLIDGAIEHMVQLMESPTIGELHEAVDFFSTACQFNIDRNTMGIIEMLRIMQRNEQERKDAIVGAFKTIYLKTDTDNATEHSKIIVQRLINLLKFIPLRNLEDLQNVLAEWSKSGFIDNNVIDMLWQFFTDKIPTSVEDRRAALELLRMASIKRHSIIKKNIKLISTIVFEKQDGQVQEDMILVGSACKALAVVGREKIDINSEVPPFKISADDEVLQSLLEVMSVNFFKNVHYYSNAIPSVVTFVYKVCSKPEGICEALLRNIIKTLVAKNEKQMPEFQMVRFCQLLGCISVRHLEYMDNTLYKELKRRNNIREQKKKDKKKDSGNARKSINTNKSVLNETNPQEESILEGAQAEDSDAEFILGVLENDTVNGSGLLGKLSFIIRNICQRPDVYTNSVTQGAAVIALIRFMLVSSRFCEDNIQLLFTIFEKTTHSDLKCTILYHCSDLLTRFPNIVEPWTPRIYQNLQDPVPEIRKATFFTLSNLILRDMIRIQGHISTMAKCIIDKNEDINKMSRTFFVQLSHKENNLYNVLPDIFSHLVETTETDDLRTIMKFLFDLMDKKKYMENLVERFCCKFQLTENVNICRNIMFCLTLITYNEKALNKLQENFPLYKHLVHDDEIYSDLKQILAGCSKQQIGKTDLKPIITEIEQAIESVFEITEGHQRPPPRPVVNKKSAKKPKGKPKRAKRKKESSDEEVDSD